VRTESESLLARLVCPIGLCRVADPCLVFTHIYPSVGVIKADALFYIMRVSPISASRTRTVWEIYGRKGIEPEQLKV
jgi:hypothetical protein